MKDQKTPWVMMLVGLPGSGKSTWIKNCQKDIFEYMGLDFVVLSTDDYIEEKAKQEGKTYSEVFKKYIDEAGAHMFEELRSAIEDNRSVIWDQTNLTRKSRASKLAKFPKHYNKIAIVFCTSDEELERRLKERGEKTGKVISLEIIQSMKNQFELPSKDEGFDDVMSLLA